MNARGDARELARVLHGLIALRPEVTVPDTAGRVAAVRDLGMFLASLKRHGVEPLSAVPAAEPVLLALGRAVDMVPRDTVLHYGAWNPRGPRQRVFLGAAQESVLIDAVRTTAPLLDAVARDLERLVALRPGTPDFADCCEAAADRLRPLPETMARVAHTVDPAGFFLARLRPFIEEITVAGRRYYGPAAAHVPLHLVDHILWAPDHGDEVQRAFQEELLEYGLPAWRDLHRRIAGRESVVTRLVRELRRHGGRPPEELARAADGVCRILRVLIVFRGRHSRVVKNAYARDPTYSTGSAGASPAVVDHVLTLTRACAHGVRAQYGAVPPRPGAGQRVPAAGCRAPGAEGRAAVIEGRAPVGRRPVRPEPSAPTRSP
ncbi:monodechloroaminopyrrolnitrin synthase PrnB family protein [Streptomyces sp. URMC 123]|uniref:monodechloroaminopyrrolnitrin synthase PrnB family protein n=1 Tax=Streptomyces sp. URMC 123 TaxID=3423403 RepID=UPI003F1C9B8E